MIAGQGRESTEGSGLLGISVDPVELQLQLGSGQLLTSDVSGDLPELIVSNDDDVFVALGRVLNGIIGGQSGDSRGVEHVFITAHGHGLLAHVFGLEIAGIDLALELESCSGDCSSSFGGISPASVVTEGVKVGDIGDDGVTITQIGVVVPPVDDPILDFGILCLCNQTLLELLANAAGFVELGDGLFGSGKLVLGEQGVDAFQITCGGLLESRDGQTGKRVLEAEHVALGLVFSVFWGPS